VRHRRELVFQKNELNSRKLRQFALKTLNTRAACSSSTTIYTGAAVIVWSSGCIGASSAILTWGGIAWSLFKNKILPYFGL
jgi:hypothetical protein